MGVIPGSNRKESSMNSLELKLWSAYRRITNKLPPFYITLNPTWIEIEAGDCLVFDQRLLHTGTLPKGPKYSIYLGYGVNNQHAQRHINYYYNRNDLDYSPMPAKLIDILLKKSLLVTELIKNTTKPSLI